MASVSGRSASCRGVQVNVMTPSFFEQFQQVFEQASLDEWKHYMRFLILDAAAPYLSNEFVEANFEFHQRKLAGVPEMKPRWKRAVEATAGSRGFGVLGDAVGRLYVAKYFTEDAKQRMSVLVANLLTAYEQSIQSLTWMTDETKTRALEKLSRSIRKSVTRTSGETILIWKLIRMIYSEMFDGRI
ncbi:MAG: M13 family metallopeptidase N-terminal domain-containing protein [Pirellulaceae bacterium]